MAVIYEGIAEDSQGLVYLISSGRKGDLWEEPKNEDDEPRQIRYASNQKSIYTEDQKGQSKLPTLMLRDGVMTVDDSDKTLIKFMDAHPLNGIKFKRVDEEADAMEELADEELTNYIKAEIFAKSKEKDGTIALESLLAMKSRTLTYSKVQEMGPAQIRKSLYVIAENEPELFVNNDEVFNAFDNKDFIYQDVIMRAMNDDVIRQNPKGNKFTWRNGEGILTVPAGKNEIEFFANWLQTEDGKEVLKQIAKEMGE